MAKVNKPAPKPPETLGATTPTRPQRPSTGGSK